MTAPRLEIDLEKIHHNACTLVQRLALRGIAVTGVTKATLGSPEIADTLLRAGVGALGDSRMENIEAMRWAGVTGSMTLIRSPMLSQTNRVVAGADVSVNTELDVIHALSSAAHEANRIHGVLLMVELGDLREGIMPGDLERVVREVLCLPNIVLKGIGTNLACRSGVSPDAKNMAELSALADCIDDKFGTVIEIVSGGNSANLDWALSGADTGRVNDLRLGESILLGREALRREPIEGLHLDAITLVAEVIESKVKPTQPWGALAQTAFGEVPPVEDRGRISQAILAIGRQDVDPNGLNAPSGIDILGASSDHLVVDSGSQRLSVGAEITFSAQLQRVCPRDDVAIRRQAHQESEGARRIYGLSTGWPGLAPNRLILWVARCSTAIPLRKTGGGLASIRAIAGTTPNEYTYSVRRLKRM